MQRYEKKHLSLFYVLNNYKLLVLKKTVAYHHWVTSVATAPSTSVSRRASTGRACSRRGWVNELWRKMIQVFFLNFAVWSRRFSCDILTFSMYFVFFWIKFLCLFQSSVTVWTLSPSPIQEGKRSVKHPSLTYYVDIQILTPSWKNLMY